MREGPNTVVRAVAAARGICQGSLITVYSSELELGAGGCSDRPADKRLKGVSSVCVRSGCTGVVGPECNEKRLMEPSGPLLLSTNSLTP